MFVLNNSMVLTITMADNIISRRNPASDLTGEKILTPIPKSSQTADLIALISLSQSGCLEAFEQLYNLFKNKVYGLTFNLPGITRQLKT